MVGRIRTYKGSVYDGAPVPNAHIFAPEVYHIPLTTIVYSNIVYVSCQRRILEISTASWSLIIGTALLLCIVAMPLINVPV